MDYERKGFVSAWLGIFPSATAFESYLRETYNDQGDVACPFWDDLGVKWLDHDFQDAHCESAGPIPAEQFLQLGFSYIESFREPLRIACERLGIASAGAGIFVYDLAYPESRPFPCPHLRFIGVFPYKLEHPKWFERLIGGGEPGTCATM
jgi:hypothetical protein